jgi:hypothetical protein
LGTQGLEGVRLEVLDVDLRSSLRTRALPWHHRDPFDRLLVAHSLEHSASVNQCVKEGFDVVMPRPRSRIGAGNPSLAKVVR